MALTNHICISRLDKMGDMILSLPVIKAIKLNNPNFKIYVLASQRNAKILRNLKYIDEIIEINTNLKFIIFIKHLFILRKSNFEYFINLSPTFLSYFYCFFSNSKNKATMIYLSRYKKTIFSKLTTRIFASLFCKYTHVVDRYTKIKKNEEIHQTEMIFKLINMCNISYKKNTLIDITLPREKLNLTPLNNSLITIHIPDKWINKYYSEDNFLKLIFELPKKNYFYVLTTDNSTMKKFNKIYNEFKVIDNNEFHKINKLKNKITILDNLNYENWINIINSSMRVITPECGCTHISSACRIPVTIIYDFNNFPEAIYKEYHPWRTEHQKLVFNDLALNEKIIKNLI